MSDEEDTSSPTVLGLSFSQQRDAITAETTLIDDIVAIVRRFMIRPNRVHNYDGTIEWHVCSDDNVSVEITIRRTDLS